MARNVTFAHELLIRTILKISIKFNILTSLVLCDRFLMGQVFQFHCLQECWKQLKVSVSVKSWSDSQLTKSSEYECDGDQQPKPFNQAELNDLVRDLNLPKASALILGSRLKAKRMFSIDTTFSRYKHRENKNIRFFAKEHCLIYCWMYKVLSWCLHINSC